MRTRFLSLIGSLFLLTPFFSFAQSTLTPGDIAIIRMNTDAPDSWAFLLLADLQAGTQIKFTDDGWRGNAGSFQGNGEDHVTWTAPAGGLPLGTVVSIEESSNDNFAVSHGSVSLSGSNFSLSRSGDQMIAYQGSFGSPTFIYAVQSNSTNWQTGNPNSSNESSLPAGLTNGTTAVAAGAGGGSTSEYDNIQYNFSTTSGTKAELLAAIGNASNWSGSNGSRYTSAIPTFTVTTLPVELVSFEATVSNNMVSLSWATASELNNDYFSIERSSDGVVFTQVGTVTGSGTSQDMQHYSFDDAVMSAGAYFYRLRQVDYDGAFSLSNLVEVEVETVSKLLRVYPNPVTGPMTIEAPEARIVNVYSLSGQKVYHASLRNGQATADLSALDRGIYVVEVLWADESRQVTRIVK